MQSRLPDSRNRQLFPASINPFTRWVIAALLTGGATVTAFAWYGYRSDWWQHQRIAPDQPVLFSHQHHAGQLGIDCRFCHGSVQDSSFAGMPATETCMTCHSGVFTDSPMLAPVLKSARTNQPLEWTRVYDLADYVYFNHSIHVTKGIGCTTCHGEIGRQSLTFKAQPLYMGWCLDCHRHPEKYIRETKDIFSPTAPPVSGLPLNRREELIRQHNIGGQHLTDCTTCHR